jgi:molybdate/tungstate transport system substrate-binding protein
MLRLLQLLALAFALAGIPAAASAQANCVQLTGQQLIVYHAGSLTAAFTPVEQAFTCQTGIEVQDNTAGSVDLLRQVTAGAKPADVVASADYVAIDRLLKPAGAASYTVVFAHGRMVLAYLDSDVTAKSLPPLVDPNSPQFAVPSSIPTVSDNWYAVLLQPGVVVGTSHPFLDPSGYRAHLMAQLAQTHAGVPNLGNDLLEHFVNTPANGPANAFTLGKQFDFQFIYEHSAAAAAASNPDYRYAYLPDDVDLSNPTKNALYRTATITMPGLGTDGAEPNVTIPATRTAWGLTIMNAAPNREGAVKFTQLLLSPDGVGQSSLRKLGPEPIAPIVTPDDWAHLPAELQSIIKSGDPLAI